MQHLHKLPEWQQILKLLQEHPLPLPPKEETQNLHKETEKLNEVISDLDALYITRMQSEWDEANESQAVDFTKFSVGPKELSLFKEKGIIMHPLPRGPEIDPTVDMDPRAMYWRQERNGMWMRVAVLLKIFHIEDQIQKLDL